MFKVITDKKDFIQNPVLEMNEEQLNEAPKKHSPIDYDAVRHGEQGYEQKVEHSSRLYFAVPTNGMKHPRKRVSVG